MLVGATGSGKSTLIDGMINYITDVSYEDDFRFSLIDVTQDEKKHQGDQTVSQTEWITTYRIPCIRGGKLDYNINIIDTPGFGDTRGIKRDKELVAQHLKVVEPKSLQLTADVLQTRMRLEITIEGLQKQVTNGMSQLNTMRQEAEILKRHQGN
ncbi:unnamed protein product [Mytilus edulis]|uniref:Septin-type G domain-containing protein n=1 Tax=Mytilus edulis TaxID=6550 RepID=A0A8S3QGG2_MYTED|nr:unnamed protein product [Mytilus edulis]